MPTELAKKVAGTYVADSLNEATPPVLAWATEICRFRQGKLYETVSKFCNQQSEILDPALMIVDGITPTGMHCKIPFKAGDHESDRTFLSEVAFELNPRTGEVKRIA